MGDLLKYIGIVNQISQALSLLLNSGADVRFKTGFLGNYVQFVETYSVEESNSQPVSYTHLDVYKRQPYAGCAANAPVVIVPVYRKEGLIAPDFAQIDLSIAQENMWLETDAQGLGGVWIGIAPVSYTHLPGSSNRNSLDFIL